MSLVQRMHFFTGQVSNDHHCTDDTWICQVKLSLTLTHSFFGMVRIFLLIATLSSVMDCRLCILQEPAEKKIRRPLGFAVPADQTIRESMVEPLNRDVGCMWSFHILLEPLHVSIDTTTCSKVSPELIQHIDVTLLCDSDYLFVCVFKPKWFDYSLFWDGYPDYAFHKVQGPMKNLVWGFCAPVHTVIAIEMSTEPKMGFVVKPNIIKEVRILLNLVLESPANH